MPTVPCLSVLLTERNFLLRAPYGEFFRSFLPDIRTDKADRRLRGRVPELVLLVEIEKLLDDARFEEKGLVSALKLAARPKKKEHWDHSRDPESLDDDADRRFLPPRRRSICRLLSQRMPTEERICETGVV